jgi:hydroxyjasmonate sulfotransferase
MAPTTEDGNPTVGEAVDTGKLIPSTLPLETRCQPFPLRRLGGFWLPEFIVPGVAAVHARFGPRPDDVFLASFPKLGTTWLKALAFAVLTRDRHPPSDPEHPLRRGSPHECVRFLEMSLALTNKGDVFAAFPSPHVLATHLPYSLLPERIATCGRVVYVCRDPKDALVSGWLFTQRKSNMLASSDTQATTYTLETAFKLFCDGVSVWGPQWRHVLGYWEASRRYPDRVLFLRYEEMLRDPAGNARRLSAFLGRPFSGEEEVAGAVDDVAELCSLDRLRRVTTARRGVTELGIESGSFFQKGAAGDWRNYLTAEMAARLDRVVAGALQGSGFSFDHNSSA